DGLLTAQAQLYTEERLTFESRWTSTYLLLEQEGPLDVTTVSRRLRLTHPGVIKLTDAMMEAGLVCETRDPHDERRRLLRLTPRAKRLAPQLHRIWKALASAQAEVFQQAG